MAGGGSNNIHNSLCSATVAKVIDVSDNQSFCPIVEKSERPLGRFEWKTANADRYCVGGQKGGIALEDRKEAAIIQ